MLSYTTTTLLLFLITLVVVVVQASPPSCLSNNGTSVDWWVIKKLPQSKMYIYSDSNNAVVAIENDITNPTTGALARTLSQLSVASDGTLPSFTAYNDMPWNDLYDIPVGTVSTSIAGDVAINRSPLQGPRGIIGVGDPSSPNSPAAAGFHIKHSLVGFPVPRSPTSRYLIKLPATHPTNWFPADYHLPSQHDPAVDGDISRGHTFICHRFEDISTLVPVIKAANPFFYASNLLPTTPFTSLYNMVTSAIPTSPPPPPTSQSQSNPTLGYSIYGSFAQYAWSPTFLTSITIPKVGVPLQGGLFDGITEMKLPIDIVRKYNVPIDVSQWSSELDDSHLAFSISIIDASVCLADSSCTNGCIVVCLNKNIRNLAALLKMSAFKQVSVPCTSYSDCVHEVQIQRPNQFKGKVMIDVDAPFVLAHVVPFIRATQDSLIRNTVVQVYSNRGECNLDCMKAIGETTTTSTNPKASLAFDKLGFAVTVLLQLQDTQTGFKMVNNNNVVLTVPMTSTKPSVYNPPELDITVIIYKTVQLLIDTASRHVDIGRLNNIVLVVDTIANTAYFNGSANAPFGIAVTAGSPQLFCINSLMRSFTYHVVKTINPLFQSAASPLFSPSSSLVSTIDSTAYPPLLRGLVNAISMKLRELSYPTGLPLSTLESFGASCSETVDIELFTTPLTIQTQGLYSEGWVTAMFWDLLDEKNDDYSDVLNRRSPNNDNNQGNTIHLHTILKAINISTSTPNDTISFIDTVHQVLLSNSQPIDHQDTTSNPQLQILHSQRIMKYNNIFKCQDICPLISNPPVIPLNPSIGDYLLSKRVCLEQIDQVGWDTLGKSFAAWTTDPSTISNQVLRNQGLKFMYEGSTLSQFINSNDGNVQSLLSVQDDGLCETVRMIQEVNRPVSPLGAILITQMLEYQSNLATHSQTFNDLSLLFVGTVVDQDSIGMVIVKHKDKLCWATVQTYSTYLTGSALDLCDSGPIVFTMDGLSSPTVPPSTSRITITGRKLVQASIKIGGLDCTGQVVTTAPATNTPHPFLETLVCKPPSGIGLQLVTYSKQGSGSLIPVEKPLKTYTFTYDAPIISNVVPASNTRLNTAGSTVSVFGSNFLSLTSDKSSIQLFEGRLLVTSFTALRQDLLIYTAFGSGKDNVLSVVVAASQVSSQNQFTVSYNAPVIQSLSSTTSSTAGNDIITVTGLNFGQTGELSVSVGGATCATDRQSNTQATFSTPPGFGSNQLVVVTLSGQNSTQTSFVINYLSPVILQVVQEPMQTAQGGYFWVVGTDLGLGAMSDEEYPIVTIFDIVVVDCEDAADYCYSNKSFVSTDGQTETTRPTIELFGDQLGQGDQFEPYILLDDSYRTTIDFECMRCQLLPGIGMDTYVNLSFAGVVSNYATQFIGYLQPTISNVDGAINVGTDGGVNVTITGTNFVPNELVVGYLDPVSDEYVDGLLEGSSNYTYVWLGNQTTKFVTVNYFNSTQIIGVAPPGIGKDIPLDIVIGAQNSTNHMQSNSTKFTFSYAAPNISSTEMSKTSGSLVTITGINFVPTNVSAGDYSNVKINQTTTPSLLLCDTINWINSTTTTCQVKPGIGANYTLQVTVGNQTNPSNNTILFSYQKPSISSIEGERNTKGGDNFRITIKGDNFVPQGVSPRSQDESYIKINDHQCTNMVWVSNQRIECSPPSGVGKDLTFILYVGNQTTAADNQTYSYDIPKVNSITKTKGRNSRENSVTIVGKNFGPEPTVKIGDTTTCTVQSTNQDHTEIICKTAITTLESEEIVKVTAGNQQSNDTNVTFTFYGPPKLDTISPDQISVNGESVTLNGKNLKEDDSGETKVYMDGTQVTIVTQSTDGTSVTVTAPSGGGINKQVYVDVGGQESNRLTYKYRDPNIFGVAPPVITSDAPSTQLTLTGSNLGLATDFPSVTVGGQTCSVSSASSSSVSCTIGQMGPGSYEVLNTFHGQTGRSTFTVNPKQTEQPTSEPSTTSTTTPATTGIIVITAGGGNSSSENPPDQVTEEEASVEEIKETKINQETSTITITALLTVTTTFASGAVVIAGPIVTVALTLASGVAGFLPGAAISIVGIGIHGILTPATGIITSTIVLSINMQDSTGMWIPMTLTGEFVRPRIPPGGGDGTTNGGNPGTTNGGSGTTNGGGDGTTNGGGDGTTNGGGEDGGGEDGGGDDGGGEDGGATGGTGVSGTQTTSMTTGSTGPVITAISGVLYYDYNQNNVHDLLEPVLRGVLITLEQSPTSTFFYQTTTNSEGKYNFNVQTRGSYVLRVLGSTPDHILPINSRSFILEASTRIVNIDFSAIAKSPNGCYGSLKYGNTKINLQYGSFNLAIYNPALFPTPTYSEVHFPTYCNVQTATSSNGNLVISYATNLVISPFIDTNMNGALDTLEQFTSFGFSTSVNVNLKITVVSVLPGESRSITKVAFITQLPYSTITMDVPGDTVISVSDLSSTPVTTTIYNNKKISVAESTMYIVQTISTPLAFLNVPPSRTLSISQYPAPTTNPSAVLSLTYGKFGPSYLNNIGWPSTSITKAAFLLGEHQSIVFTNPDDSVRIYHPTGTEYTIVSNIQYGSIEILDPLLFGSNTYQSNGGNVVINQIYSYAVPTFTLDGVAMSCTLVSGGANTMNCVIPPYTSGNYTKPITMQWNGLNLYPFYTISYVSDGSSSSTSATSTTGTGTPTSGTSTETSGTSATSGTGTGTETTGTSTNSTTGSNPCSNTTTTTEATTGATATGATTTTTTTGGSGTSGTTSTTSSSSGGGTTGGACNSTTTDTTTTNPPTTSGTSGTTSGTSGTTASGTTTIPSTTGTTTDPSTDSGLSTTTSGTSGTTTDGTSGTTTSGTTTIPSTTGTTTDPSTDSGLSTTTSGTTTTTDGTSGTTTSGTTTIPSTTGTTTDPSTDSGLSTTTTTTSGPTTSGTSGPTTSGTTTIPSTTGTTTDPSTDSGLSTTTASGTTTDGTTTSGTTIPSTSGTTTDPSTDSGLSTTTSVTTTSGATTIPSTSGSSQ
ncbi:hypothetical protein DFA_02132 [Cavenderia fasciculata]|uniref:IPT/TIG domain-containing protein n=1 Tax=Cavenderia fasciculata TaxID=261658 RepID=F4PYS9_CACFS|nr:uncharacterized protein DFA_02132 [Cavenderia fasciculata]EGG19345.1 hypothetical protein DFA_02132 [Cavenderia fasciculata]|eukprot:XP_004357616.1 hypothetical protein DFA_02132 [Cavenderia fasciculata]